MDNGKTFDNAHINYIELKKYLDSLVWTQNIYTKIKEQTIFFLLFLLSDCQQLNKIWVSFNTKMWHKD